MSKTMNKTMNKTIITATAIIGIATTSILFLIKHFKKEKSKIEDVNIANLSNETIYAMAKRLRNKIITFDSGESYTYIKPLCIKLNKGQRIIEISAINIKTKLPVIIKLSDYEVACLNYKDIENENT